MLDDIISCSHDKFGRIGEVFPIVGKDLIDECLLFEIFKDGRWKGLDVVFAGVIRVLDDGLVFRFFKLGEEMAEAGCELLDGFASGVVAFDGEKLFVVGFGGSFVKRRLVEKVEEIEHDLGTFVLPLGLEGNHAFEIRVGIGDELGVEEGIGFGMEVDVGVVDVAFGVEETLGESFGTEAGNDEKVIFFHGGCVLGGEGERWKFDGSVKVGGEELIDLVLLL